ncbi:hypothetical protein SAMN04488511_11958 [Pedobacter suwonensis]|uniref:Uncharacterized protein n=1 Tax=Pedobacter suwonensis TaxID=332999 RepID=A0A1I0U386_9SPHI|nr:hypothetical protein [Pedobacter suwonensis]SFA58458.1 hypothetical protein SAMN04488511_11958 [Pedobacter suwonensis]
MKTTVIGSGKDSTTTVNKSTEKAAIRPSLPLKDATKTQAKEEPKSEADTTKPIETKNEPVKSAVTPEAPKAEPTKIELKEQLQEQKPQMNLDATIKFALELNRRINQRGKLLDTINTLEEFEVLQKDDADETESNHYQRCELTIEDDKGREFTTKNPFIINAVAAMVNKLCIDKLAEIEGDIHFPIK